MDVGAVRLGTPTKAYPKTLYITKLVFPSSPPPTATVSSRRVW